MDPRDEELLRGMGNCYDACHENFDETVGMVAGSRHRSAEDVIATLRAMRTKYSSDELYQSLRARFPAEFPV